MLFCVAVHWLGLKMWFFTDDFAWLGLRQDLHTPRDLIHILFSPQAQGTVRTLSERLFFLVFTSIFGLESPPFRVWVFLTQFANIVLFIQIARRISGSPLAAFLAALLWTANAGIAMAISWSSSYNEIAVAFFILLAFRLFLAHIDTGERKYWIWQWIAFLLGFGALELMVVYPALAACYALCCARPYFRKTLYLFAPSVLFTVAHFLFVPKSQDRHYHMHFDTAMFTTLWKYWAYGMGALREVQAGWRPLWLGLVATLLITTALAVFVYRKTRSRNWSPIFLVAWFAIVLLPLLPLKDHFTEYYLTVPVIGIAMLAGWAITSNSTWFARGVAAALACLYLTLSVSDIHMVEKYRYNNSRRMKYLIQGLESQQKIHPREEVLLSGIDSELFWTGFCDNPFRLIGIYHVYLVPGHANDVHPHPEWSCDVSHFFVNVDDAVPMLRANQGAVYALEGRNVRDITADYLRTASMDYAVRHPDFIEVSDPMFQNRLGPTWYPPERGYRWMPKTAAIRIHGPTKSGQILEANGYCPAVLLAEGPLGVSFRWDGVPLGTSAVTQPNAIFSLHFPLPDQLVGQPMLELEIEVSRTFQPQDDHRPFGLVFTTFTIR